MNYKYLALGIVGLLFVFQMVVDWLSVRSANREIPDSVKDVYDQDSYEKWLAYFHEERRLYFVGHIASHVVTLLVIASDAYAKIANALFPEGIYGAAIAVLAADTLIGLIYSLPLNYWDSMVIEQKYGFNQRTLKTFIIDQIKDLVIGFGVMAALCSLFILIHQTLGNWLLPVFGGAVLLVLLIVVALNPLLSKIYNKFEPLPDGTLRDRLTALLTENGCTVKAVNVMDGSKRSSKANAYFSGLGRTKTIVLYDTLLEQMTEDEIVAVFAHEVGHNKHRDTLKMYCMSTLNIAILVFLAWGLISVPGIYQDFGFSGVNYGFTFYLLGSVCAAALSPFLGLLTSAFSRRYEYAADRFAAENGYGEALISALKKLARNSFACLTPHPVLVALTYSHPTISQRVAALEVHHE